MKQLFRMEVIVLENREDLSGTRDQPIIAVSTKYLAISSGCSISVTMLSRDVTCGGLLPRDKQPVEVMLPLSLIPSLYLLIFLSPPLSPSLTHSLPLSPYISLSLIPSLYLPLSLIPSLSPYLLISPSLSLSTSLSDAVVLSGHINRTYRYSNLSTLHCSSYSPVLFFRLSSLLEHQCCCQRH